MLKIAFYLDNRNVPSTDFTMPENGNPGVGAAEYLHVAIPFYLEKECGSFCEVIIYAHNKDKLPSNVISYEVEDIVDAAEKAASNNVNIFIFRPRVKEELNILDVIDRLKLPSIGRAALTPSVEHLRKMSKSQYFKALVCVGREQFDYLVDTPISSKRVLINNGVSPIPFENSSNVEKNEKLVVYLGSLVYQKGFHLLAKAWPKVLKEVPDAKLSVIGSAKVYNDNAKLGSLGIASEEYEDKYIKPYLVKDGKLMDSVLFHGQLGYEKYEILRKAVIGIANPSGQTETCCVSAVEISASGTAVVSGAYYALLDTVRNKETGLLGYNTKDLEKNIIFLLKNPNYAIELGLNGKDFFYNNYDFKIVIKKWVSLINCIKEGHDVKSLRGSEKYKNILRHRKFLRIINSHLQNTVGKIVFWPSIYEVDIFLIKLLRKFK